MPVFDLVIHAPVAGGPTARELGLLICGIDPGASHLEKSEFISARGKKGLEKAGELARTEGRSPLVIRVSKLTRREPPEVMHNEAIEVGLNLLAWFIRTHRKKADLGCSTKTVHEPAPIVAVYSDKENPNLPACRIFKEHVSYLGTVFRVSYVKGWLGGKGFMKGAPALNDLRHHIKLVSSNAEEGLAEILAQLQSAGVFFVDVVSDPTHSKPRLSLLPIPPSNGEDPMNVVKKKVAEIFADEECKADRYAILEFPIHPTNVPPAPKRLSGVECLEVEAGGRKNNVTVNWGFFPVASMQVGKVHELRYARVFVFDKPRTRQIVEPKKAPAGKYLWRIPRVGWGV